jgi:UDP-N-acetyl-D-glucosamine dehydrogenase
MRSRTISLRDFHIAFSPERTRAAPTSRCATPPRWWTASHRRALNEPRRSTGWCATNLPRVGTLEAAELTKLLENIFRSVNIALVNELAMLTDRMHIDIWEVLDAASTKPYGSCAYSPDPAWAATACPSTHSI